MTSTGKEMFKCNVCGFWHDYYEGLERGCFK